MSHKVELIKEHLQTEVDAEAGIGPVFGISEERLVELSAVINSVMNGTAEGTSVSDPDNPGNLAINMPVSLEYLTSQAANANEAALLCITFGKRLEARKNPFAMLMGGMSRD